MGRIIYCFIFWISWRGAAAQSPWPTTHLGEHAVVEMPYEGTLEEDPKLPGAQRYWTSTSDNEFQVIRVDLRSVPGYDAGAAPVAAGLDKLYDKAARLYNRHAIKGRLHAQSSVLIGGRPARAAIYQGFDDYHQLSTRIETAWVWHGDALYLIACSYTLPETAGAIADKNQFFSSVRFVSPTASEE